MFVFWSFVNHHHHTHIISLQDEIRETLPYSDQQLRVLCLNAASAENTSFPLYSRAHHVYSEADRVLTFKTLCENLSPKWVLFFYLFCSLFISFAVEAEWRVNFECLISVGMMRCSPKTLYDGENLWFSHYATVMVTVIIWQWYFVRSPFQIGIG